MPRVAVTPDEARARVPAVLDAWRFIRSEVVDGGAVDPALKGLCYRHLAEDPETMDVDAFAPRERAALRWTRAIAWDSSLADDALWSELHRLFSEPELVELGCAIGFVLGQQHWERTLGFAPHAGLS
jgi:alkylhydroperoxidase family enzyme